MDKISLLNLTDFVMVAEEQQALFWWDGNLQWNSTCPSYILALVCHQNQVEFVPNGRENDSGWSYDVHSASRWTFRAVATLPSRKSLSIFAHPEASYKVAGQFSSTFN